MHFLVYNLGKYCRKTFCPPGVVFQNKFLFSQFTLVLIYRELFLTREDKSDIFNPQCNVLFIIYLLLKSKLEKVLLYIVESEILKNTQCQ
jgi:hypothetical protein